MDNIEILSHRIKEFCLLKDLSSYDPYDIWYTEAGKKIKRIFYKNKYLGIIPAGVLTIFDTFFNNAWRLGYTKRNYPIVHGLRVQACLNFFKTTEDTEFLKAAEESLEWLLKNYSKGYSGYCWGANIPWVSKSGTYDENIPHITHTPYALEAFVKYSQVTRTNKYDDIIKSIFDFIEKDIPVLYEDENTMALAYSPLKEKRIVVNANSYAMYCYALLKPYFPEQQEYIANKIHKIYNYIVQQQQKDGSWWYYTDTMEGNFIDAFHTCFVLKNILKTNSIIPLLDSHTIVQHGYSYFKKYFYDAKDKLVRRFSVRDKASLIRYDLYDNAEAIHIAKMMNDTELYKTLTESTALTFTDDRGNIYSTIDALGFKRNNNTLRWAVMPYIYAMTS